MRCVILQPSFVPWRGYFRQIAGSDAFVFYDDVQFDKHGWRNRNRLDVNGELEWLTIPVRGSTQARLDEVAIDWNGNWPSKLRKRLTQTWSKRPHATETIELVERHLDARPERLVDLTIPLTIEIAVLLGLAEPTTFHRSSQLGIVGGKTERLVNITSSLGCDEYHSGPSARDYLDEPLFTARGITVNWEDYEFPEATDALRPEASILDYLSVFWTSAARFIRPPMCVVHGGSTSC